MDAIREKHAVRWDGSGEKVKVNRSSLWLWLCFCIVFVLVIFVELNVVQSHICGDPLSRSDLPRTMFGHGMVTIRVLSAIAPYGFSQVEFISDRHVAIDEVVEVNCYCYYCCYCYCCRSYIEMRQKKRLLLMIWLVASMMCQTGLTPDVHHRNRWVDWC